MEELFVDLNLYSNSEDITANIIVAPLHLFFQEIELAVTIAPNELWGFKDNIELDKYLFNQYITINQIKNEITRFISDNCEHASLFQHTIEVQLLNVEGKDLIYIVISIYSEEEDKSFVQKFVLGT